MDHCLVCKQDPCANIGYGMCKAQFYRLHNQKVRRPWQGRNAFTSQGNLCTFTPLSNSSFTGHAFPHNFNSNEPFCEGTFSYLNEYYCGLCCWKTCVGVAAVLAYGFPDSLLRFLPPPSVSFPAPSSGCSLLHTWPAVWLPTGPQPKYNMVSL